MSMTVMAGVVIIIIITPLRSTTMAMADGAEAEVRSLVYNILVSILEIVRRYQEVSG